MQYPDYPANDYIDIDYHLQAIEEAKMPRSFEHEDFMATIRRFLMTKPAFKDILEILRQYLEEQISSYPNGFQVPDDFHDCIYATSERIRTEILRKRDNIDVMDIKRFYMALSNLSQQSNDEADQFFFVTPEYIEGMINTFLVNNTSVGNQHYEVFSFFENVLQQKEVKFQDKEVLPINYKFKYKEIKNVAFLKEMRVRLFAKLRNVYTYSRESIALALISGIKDITFHIKFCEQLEVVSSQKIVTHINKVIKNDDVSVSDDVTEVAKQLARIPPVNNDQFLFGSN